MTEGRAMAKSDISHVYVGAAQVTGGSLGGLFRQRVGDDRWERLTKGLPEQAAIQAVTVHPSNPQVIFAGTQDGPYRSDDGGTTFKRPDFPRDLAVWSITVHPSNPRVIYAGTSPVGVFRSEDGGDTWTRLARAVQPDKLKMSFACRVMRIGIVAGQPDLIHAALEVGGTMRSLDGGRDVVRRQRRSREARGRQREPQEHAAERQRGRGHARRPRAGRQQRRARERVPGRADGPVPERRPRQELEGHGDQPVLAAHVRPRHPACRPTTRARSTPR